MEETEEWTSGETERYDDGETTAGAEWTAAPWRQFESARRVRIGTKENEHESAQREKRVIHPTSSLTRTACLNICKVSTTRTVFVM
jgi:hypothetical protein